MKQKQRSYLRSGVEINVGKILLHFRPQFSFVWRVEWSFSSVQGTLKQRERDNDINECLCSLFLLFRPLLYVHLPFHRSCVCWMMSNLRNRNLILWTHIVRFVTQVRTFVDANPFYYKFVIKYIGLDMSPRKYIQCKNCMNSFFF